MTSCTVCGTFVLPATSCPHCVGGATSPLRRLPTAAALAVTVALASGCYGSGMSMSDTSFMDTSSTEDADGDGYSPADGDCDDADDSVNPGVAETMGDGVDSNCDGEDDT